MHKLFVPVPDWLDLSKEQKHIQAQRHSPHSNEFLLECFKTLYKLGMTDRQVVELTALFVILSENNKFDVVITSLLTSSSKFKGWYRKGSGIFLWCSSLSETIEEWVNSNLPCNDTRNAPAQSFYAGSSNWVGFFLQSSEQKRFFGLTEQTRNKFAQHCLGLPMTGNWDSRSEAACKKFQEVFPKAILPWKHGSADGLTYKLLVKKWKKANGL